MRNMHARDESDFHESQERVKAAARGKLRVLHLSTPLTAKLMLLCEEVINANFTQNANNILYVMHIWTQYPMMYGSWNEGILRNKYRKFTFKDIYIYITYIYL